MDPQRPEGPVPMIGWANAVAVGTLGVSVLALICAEMEVRRTRRILAAWLEARRAVRAAYAASLAGHPDEDRLDDEARLAIAAAWEEQRVPSAWIVRASAPLLAWLAFPVDEIQHPEEGQRCRTR